MLYSRAQVDLVVKVFFASLVVSTSFDSSFISHADWKDHQHHS